MTGKAAGSPAYWRYAGDRERGQAPAGPGQRKETSDTRRWRLGLSVAPQLRVRRAGHEAAQHFQWRHAVVHDGDHVFDDRDVDTVGAGELEDRLTRLHPLRHLPRD